ncbi:MAG: SRPBCC family protein [Ignavibacteriaceae bacterium]
MERSQKIPGTIEKVWDFISSPSNLEKITPSYMGFKITGNNLPGKIYPGLIIRYKLSPLLGIKITWVTEITHVKEKEFFVDEQRVGPYSIWHHQHKIEAVKNGVLMTDIVTYKPPFGILGRLSNQLFIKKRLESIFDFRKSALEKIYGKYPPAE